MSTTEPEVKFEKMRLFSRRLALAPVLAMFIAGSIFIIEGLPFPGRTTFLHGLSPRLFDILVLFVWMLFLVVLVPLVILLVDRNLKKIHAALRFALLARLVLYAWVIFFAARLMQSVYNGVPWFPEMLLRNFIFTGILVGVYFYFKRKYVEKPETMFP